MITFSGKDYVNLKNEKGFTFSMQDTSFDNITGSGCFGFSGALNKSFNFKFIKGSILDAENNLFYNYDKDEKFTLSGIVDESRYGYYVDDALYKKAGTRSNYKIQNFFVETSVVKMKTTLNVYAKEPKKLTVTFPDTFNLSGLVTGTISNASSTYAREVVTGSLDAGTEVEFKSIEKTGHLTVSSSINFVLESKSGSLGEIYDLPLVFNTSAGRLDVGKTSKAGALNALDKSELDAVNEVFSSGFGEALSYDTGLYFFNNIKQSATGSGAAGDSYSLFLKYNGGYTGEVSGWAGGISIGSAGSGWGRNEFTVTGDAGNGATGYLKTLNGGVTGLSITSLGQNYSGATAGISISQLSGSRSVVSGSGLSLGINRDLYNKKFWDAWSLSTGTSATGSFTNVTTQTQTLTALSGAPSNEDFFIRVKSKNYYDAMIQKADLIVSGMTNGKQFTRTITGVA